MRASSAASVFVLVLFSAQPSLSEVEVRERVTPAVVARRPADRAGRERRWTDDAREPHSLSPGSRS